jgi:Tfp pilus assembly protein PilO
VVVLAVWYQLVWKPQGRSIVSAHERQNRATAALFTAEQRLGHLKHLAAESAQFTALSDRLNAAIPAQDHLDAVITDVNAEAASAGLSLSGLTFATPAASSTGVQILPAHLSLTGGYFSLLRFLDELRNGPRLVVIDTMSVSSASASPGVPAATRLSVTIAARLFVATGGPVAAPAATPSPPKTGTGVVETPINAAKGAAQAANRAGAAQAGSTP